MASLVTAAVIFTPWVFANAHAAKTDLRGKDIYNYYCYQCHGYSGDARTLASTYLDPAPRDFTTADPVRLNREAIIDAVSNGRPGTAMVGFQTVLSSMDIRAVAEFIRQSFMSATRARARYHTVENGWERHDRYQVAYPFVNNEIPLGKPWEALTDAQRLGKRLYLEACVSCHDHGPSPDQGPIWELYAVTYPHHEEEANEYGYSDEEYADEYSKYLPYSVHGQAPRESGLSDAERRGRGLYKDNCAFCHAGDGTGRNWIGSFLQPRPTDLSGPRTAMMSRTRLHALIKRGLPGTAMPAWGDALEDREISNIVDYIANVLSVSRPARDQTHPSQIPSSPATIGWMRKPPANGKDRAVQ